MALVEQSPQQIPVPSPSNGAKFSSEGRDDSEEEDLRLVQIGGEIATPAFALLDGVVYENHDDDAPFKSVTIPITRLPATIGRTHDTKDPNFFGLGPKKVVSREQFRIFYQSAFGGTLGQKDSSDELAYQGPRTNPEKGAAVPSNKADDEPLPSEGHFAIECLGKNKIMVGKKRVQHGEVAPLESGMPIKIGSYCLYFLLPTDAPEKTMSIPNPAYKKPRKRPSTTTADPGSLPNKKSRHGGGGELKKELESMNVKDLIAEITALESEQLGHRHKLIRSIVLAHGVRDAFRANSIRNIAKEKGAISKAAIADWLAENDLYSEFVKHTLSTMEAASYQTSITRALMSAGCERIGSTGRFVMWKLPKGCLSDGDEEKHDDVDGPGNASERDDSNGQGVRMNDMDEDSDEDEGDQEDEKETGAESEGVPKNDLDDDGDDDESDEKENESQESQGVGKEDMDESSQDSERERETRKDSPSEIRKDGVNQGSDDNAGEEEYEEDEKGSLNEDQFDETKDDDDDDDHSSDDASPWAKGHNKEMDLDGHEEGSGNDEMEGMDDGNDASNAEIPKANNSEVESPQSGRLMECSDLPGADAVVNRCATTNATGNIAASDMEISDDEE